MPGSAKQLAMFLLLLWMPGPSVVLAESVDPVQALEINRHIASLGASRYADREQATTALIEQGLAAASALKIAQQSDDREVRDRAAYALREILVRDRPRLLALLQNGAVSENDEQLVDLPGWHTLSQLVEDHQAAQKLLADALEANWDFLETIHTDGVDVNAALSDQCMRVLRNRSETRRIATRGDMVAVMLSGLLNTESLADQTLNNVFTIVNHARPSVSGDRSAIENGAFRQLAAELISRSSQSSAAFQGLNLALTLDLEEGRNAAIQVLRRQESRAHVKVFAMMTLLRFGSLEDSAVIEPYLQDLQTYHTAPTSRRATQRSDGGDLLTYSVQVRDVALACFAELHGVPLRELGFKVVQKHAHYVFNPSTLGFSSAEGREQAFEQLETLLAKQAR